MLFCSKERSFTIQHKGENLLQTFVGLVQSVLTTWWILSIIALLGSSFYAIYFRRTQNFKNQVGHQLISNEKILLYIFLGMLVSYFALNLLHPALRASLTTIIS